MRLIDKLRSDTSFFCELANALMIGARRNDISIQHYFGPQFCTYGASFTLGELNVQGVFWDEVTKKISVYPVRNDAISFKFSGCIMARFRIHEVYYVAHIHTDKDQELDCRKAWADFILNNENIIDELIMFKPGSEGTGFPTGGCHGIITRCGQCYTVRIDPYTNQCSNIHLHRQTKRRVEDYKEILELARNQCDFKSMKDGWESYWKWGRVFHESLSASEAYDHASGNSCCILI